MAYDPKKPTTAGNCATRASLERGLDTPGFLHESIHARHTQQKRDNRVKNMQARQLNGGKRK